MHFRSHQSAIERFSTFTIKIEDLVREIVVQNDIPYYRIESMVDHRTDNPSDEQYVPVIRIITYFEDTVAKISHILESELDVQQERSISKKDIRVETFSYKHINYSAGLKANRRELTEYKRLGDKKFEIQISSMLQDAWSGIEKELGYDTAVVADEAKRDFYRVGALLEMADIEFLRVRTEHAKKRVAHQAENNVAANANTFAEHLQTVAKEPQPVAPVVAEQPIAAPAPQPVYAPPAPVYVAPVVEAPVVAPPAPVYVAPVVEVPVVAPPAPVMEAPVAAAPEAATPPPIEIPVVAYQPPVAIPEPVVTAPVFEIPVVAASQPVAVPPVFDIPVAAQPIVEKIESVFTAAPVAAVAEQVQEKVQDIAAAYPQAAPVAEAAKSVIAGQGADDLKALADSINNVKKEVPTVAEAYVAPVMQAIVPPAIPELPHTVAEEVVAPVMASIPLPSTPVSNLNVNSNGMMEDAAQTVREQVADKVPAFYDDIPNKNTKTIQLDENAPMTDMSLREYVLNSKLLKEVDMQIAERAGAKINFEIDIEGDVERLRFLKVYTLKQLHERLADNKDDIVAFAEKWIGKDNGGSFDSGISLFYLEYLLVGKKNDPAFAVEYVVKFISDNDYSARYIIPTYNSIRNTEAPNFSHLTLRA